MEAATTPAPDEDSAPALRVVSGEEEPSIPEEQGLSPALVQIPVLIAGAVRRRVSRVGVPEEQQLTMAQEEHVIRVAQGCLVCHYPSPTPVPRVAIEEIARNVVDDMEFVQGRTAV